MSNYNARLDNHNSSNTNPYQLEGKFSINSEPLLVSSAHFKGNSHISKQPTYSQGGERAFKKF